MSITLDGSNLTTTGVINSGTAVASTSGTSIDFTGLPSGLKRITVMFNVVSTNGTSNLQIQIGSGSITNTGYSSRCVWYTSASAGSTGFIITTSIGASTDTQSGTIVLTLLSNNTWTGFGNLVNVGNAITTYTAGVSPALGGVLDRVRITTVNGTDTFDAGSINILYE